MVISAMLFHSCEKWIDPDINQNPNQPADVTMEALLPFIEAGMAFRLAGGNEVVNVQAVWLQQFDGVDRQSLAFANYVYNPLEAFYIWTDSYAEMLMDSRILREKAAQLGSPHNHGVAGILSAFALGQLTDAWGDIPWSEALQGAGNPQPVFDSQESIYLAIHELLDHAIDSLAKEQDPYGIKGDYIYSGDPQKWIRAAHAFKARYFLHLSKRKGSQAYLDALDAIPDAFTDNHDDMQFNFGTGQGESNPLYQFMRDRNDVRMGAYFIDLLKNTEDPRLAVYAYPDGQGNYTGSVAGQANDQASTPGPAVASPESPSYFITYAELLFIRAEALLKTGSDEAQVKIALEEAVAASLEKLGVNDPEWLSGYREKIAGMTGETLFAEIMTQKYIATFYQPETYHSWRRTAYPVIPPNPNGLIGEIPRRFLYPTSEQVYNPNVPTGISLTDRVWWDE